MDEFVVHIELRDGFVDDHVVVTVNGEEVYDRERVSTRFQIGLADQTDIAIGEEAVTVRVAVPSQRAAAEVRFDVAAETWVGVSYLENALQFEISSRPFWYM